MKLIQWLSQHLSLSIPIFMLLGLLTGSLFDAQPLAVLIAPLTMLMVYPMMVGVRMQQLFNRGNNAVQWWAIAINFLFIPFLAFALGRLVFPNQPALALGLLLAALLPTSGMTISWTGFAKGNVPAAIKLTLIGLLLGSLLTPFYVKFLLGASIPVEIAPVFKQILLFVLLPLLAGQATRHWLIHRHGQAHFQQHYGPKFPPFSSLGVLGIVFVAMALQGPNLLQSPLLVLQLLLPLLLLYGINYTLSTWLARKVLNRSDGIALVYGTVMRNLSIALALSMTAFGDAGTQAALLVALAYIVQVQSAAIYVRWAQRLFPVSNA